MVVLVVVPTVAPSSLANWMAKVPIPPEPAGMNTFCPALRPMRSFSACHEVNPTIGIATIIYFLIYQQFDAYVLYPTVLKRTVKVPGALVVLSAIVGGMLFGVIGAVIAIHTTAALLLLYREIAQPALDAA